MHRKRVDFPDPLKPMTARNSPCSTLKLTLSNARTPPSYIFVRFLTSNMGVEHLPFGFYEISIQEYPGCERIKFQ
jgi:hypothetical protein